MHTKHRNSRIGIDPYRMRNSIELHKNYNRERTNILHSDDIISFAILHFIYMTFGTAL
jgi:hypothetical protein